MAAANAPQHLFARMLDRVRAACAPLVGASADLSRVVVEPPRDPSHGDMATNAAMVLAKDAGQKPRELAEKIAEALRGDDLVAKAEVAGAGFINLTLQTACVGRGAARRAGGGQGLWPQRHGQGRKGQRRIRLGQSDRADACRARPRRGVRRCARQSAGLRRLRRDARILHQRRRRAGRRAGALGLPALPRGARRGYRADPGGALSRRLSQAGGRRARRRTWRGAQRKTGVRMAADRARQGHRHDDGHDPRRSRRAQCARTTCSFPSAR